MSEFQCLICVSTAAGELGAQDVANTMEKSTVLNQRDGVQGMLLLSDGNFMKCIEGERSGVECTYERILASRLHHREIELFRSPVAALRFSGWNWAFQLGNRRDCSNADTSQFLESPRHDHPVAREENALEQKILREFWDTTTTPHRIW